MGNIKVSLLCKVEKCNGKDKNSAKNVLALNGWDLAKQEQQQETIIQIGLNSVQASGLNCHCQTALTVNKPYHF